MSSHNLCVCVCFIRIYIDLIRAFQRRLSGQTVEKGADVTQERQDIEPQLPSSVGRRTRRNRRVLASVNGEEESVAGTCLCCFWVWTDLTIALLHLLLKKQFFLKPFNF